MPVPSQEPDELVRRAVAGDAQAREELLERILPRLRAFVRLRAGEHLRAHESCADLVQSVCAEVLAELPRLEYGGPEAFRGWLFAMAERKLADRARYWRAAKRDHGREAWLDWDEPGEEAGRAEICSRLASPSQGAMAREEMERLERAFRRLGETHRQVIVLARLAGLSHAEIGRRLGRSEQAARSLLFRALAELAEGLGRA